MKKVNVSAFIIAFLAIILTGCSPFVTSFSTTSSYSPAGANKLPVPLLTLEYAGQSTSSSDNSYNLNVGDVSSSGAGPAISGQPGSQVLQTPVGVDVEIVVAFSTPPATLWVVELDEKGVPQTSTAFRPVSYRTRYKLTTLGKYRLQVFAEWDANNYVRSIFDIETH